MGIKSSLEEGKGHRRPYISLWGICINTDRKAAAGIVLGSSGVMMFLQENVQLDPAGRGSAAAGSSGSTCKPAELCLSPSRGEYQDPGLLSLLEGSGRINEFTAQECSQETTTRESEQLQTWKVCEAETRAPCGEAKKKREVRMSQRRKTSGISDTAPSRALRAAFQVLHLGFPGGIRARLGQVLLLQPCCWYP